MSKYQGQTDHEKEFIRIFNEIAKDRHPWEVWSDFITISACSLSNTYEPRKDIYNEREKTYTSIIKKYSDINKSNMARLLAVVIEAMDENPKQDFLGNLYMMLDFGREHAGQFFTPWHISELMAKVTLQDMKEVKKKIKEEGYISVADTCCGAGCMLIAFASVCLDEKINYQQSVFFFAQDIDPIVAKMCFIQLSLLGCPAKVVVGNSLLEPDVKDESRIWYTLFYYNHIWSARRIKKSFESLDEDATAKQVMEDISKLEKTVAKVPSKPKPILKESKGFSLKKFFGIERRDK